MKLGDRLKTLRKNANLTLKQLNENTGLSVSYLSDLERGKTKPSLDTLNKLASVYKTSVSSMMEDVEGWGEEQEDIQLPSGLLEIKNDPMIGHFITDEDLRSLSRISLRGKQPQTSQDWKQIYLYLYTMLPPEEK